MKEKSSSEKENEILKKLATVLPCPCMFTDNHKMMTMQIFLREENRRWTEPMEMELPVPCHGGFDYKYITLVSLICQCERSPKFASGSPIKISQRSLPWQPRLLPAQSPRENELRTRDKEKTIDRLCCRSKQFLKPVTWFDSSRSRPVIPLSPEWNETCILNPDSN